MKIKIKTIPLKKYDNLDNDYSYNFKFISLQFHKSTDYFGPVWFINFIIFNVNLLIHNTRNEKLV
jgi:hypothetical protein